MIDIISLKVPQECSSSMNSYRINVTSAEGNEVTVFPCVRSDGRSLHLLVENLMRNISYSFSIISNNNVGQQSTAAIFFCKENSFSTNRILFGFCSLSKTVIRYSFLVPLDELYFKFSSLSTRWFGRCPPRFFQTMDFRSSEHSKEYSLVQVNEAFSLNMTVVVRLIWNMY